MSHRDNRLRIINPHFARDMEAAALMQLRAALSQGLDDAGCIAFATASLGREHAELVRRVWDEMPKIMWGAG